MYEMLHCLLNLWLSLRKPVLLMQNLNTTVHLWWLPPILLCTRTIILCKWHKQSLSTRQAKTVVGYSLAPHTSLLMPFTGSTGPIVHLYGLTGLRKAICEGRLGYLYPYAWCTWTVQECSFNIKLYKLDFSCCANKDGFANPVT